MSAERRTRWTDAHGDKPLGSKFHVYCAADGEARPALGEHHYPDAARLGATGEFVFVLRPESDYAAYAALREYVLEASWDARRQPLADDIDAQLDRIKDEQA